MNRVHDNDYELHFDFGMELSISCQKPRNSDGTKIPNGSRIFPNIQVWVVALLGVDATW